MAERTSSGGGHKSGAHNTISESHDPVTPTRGILALERTSQFMVQPSCFLMTIEAIWNHSIAFVLTSASPRSDLHSIPSRDGFPACLPLHCNACYWSAPPLFRPIADIWIFCMLGVPWFVWRTNNNDAKMPLVGVNKRATTPEKSWPLLQGFQPSH